VLGVVGGQIGRTSKGLEAFRLQLWHQWEVQDEEKGNEMEGREKRGRWLAGRGGSTCSSSSNIRSAQRSSLSFMFLDFVRSFGCREGS